VAETVTALGLTSAAFTKVVFNGQPAAEVAETVTALGLTSAAFTKVVFNGQPAAEVAETVTRPRTHLRNLPPQMIQVPIGHAVRFRREILDANNRPSGGLRLHITSSSTPASKCSRTPKSADCWNVLVLGTGSKPTKRDSGIVTASLAAGVVTASAAFFEAADVGRTFKFDNTAKEYRITEYQSATAVAVDSSDTVAADQFMIWYSNEVTHGAEHSRIITYATDAGFNGYTTDDATGTWTNFRTFLSPTFAADTLITEIGWAPSTSAGSQLFGRALVPGGGDYVVAGQKYRVRVEHSMVWGPREVVAVGNICQQDGFDTSGAFALERVPKCSCVNSDGTPEE
jgi:hypothetical protein